MTDNTTIAAELAAALRWWMPDESMLDAHEEARWDRDIKLLQQYDALSNPGPTDRGLVAPLPDETTKEGWQIELKPDPGFPPYIRIQSPDNKVEVIINKNPLYSYFLPLAKPLSQSEDHDR